MIKDTRYIIKRVIIGVLISLILSFIYACDVKAESIGDYRISTINRYKINSSSSFSSLDSRYTNYLLSSQGNTLFLGATTTLQSDVGNAGADNINKPTLYGRYTLCADSGTFSEGWNVQHAELVRFINTKIPCRLANAQTYDQSYVSFATFRYSSSNIINGSTSSNANKVTFLMNAELQIASTFQRSSSWSVLAYEVSFNQFPYYEESDGVFREVDKILEAINTLISQGNGASTITSAITNQTTTITNAQNNTTNAVNQNTQAINNTNNTLKDDNVDDPSSSLNDMDSKIATNSVISDLLLLPVSLFQKVINSINGTCSTFNLGSLFGTNLTLPCINLSNILGSALYGIIDVLLCGIFVLSMRKKFVSIFENITSLKDRGNELE